MVAFIDSTPVQKFEKQGIYILGINYDGSACFRKGTRNGPDAIRDASQNLESYSPYLNKQLTDLEVFDIGNIESHDFKDLKEKFQKTINLDLKKSRLLTLGGEHSISIMPFEKYLQSYPDLTLIQLDAHADLRDSYEGNKNSHACIMKRCLDLIQPNKIIQYGIRSGTKEEFQWMNEHQTLYKNLDKLIKKIESIPGPIYLTLDVDFFDPSYVSGTGTPEAGGETFQSFLKIIKTLASKRFIGADIVELAPNWDLSGASNCFVSKCSREILLALK